MVNTRNEGQRTVLQVLNGTGLIDLLSGSETGGTTTEPARSRYSVHQTNYGTDTSDVERVGYWENFDSTKAFEITDVWCELDDGSDATVGDFAIAIADGETNEQAGSSSVGASNTVDWRGNQAIAEDESGVLPFTLSDGNEMVIEVYNDTGAAQQASWGFIWRLV